MKTCKICNGLMIVGSEKWWKILETCSECDGTGVVKTEEEK